MDAANIAYELQMALPDISDARRERLLEKLLVEVKHENDRLERLVGFWFYTTIGESTKIICAELLKVCPQIAFWRSHNDALWSVRCAPDQAVQVAAVLHAFAEKWGKEGR